MPVAENRLEVLQVCKLLQCVRDKDKEQIAKLVQNGCPQLINYNDKTSGDTALTIAAVANDESMIEFLVALGAHPDVRDFKYRSPVMRCAEYGHVESMKQLATAGAEMKLTDIDGRGILYYCFKAASSRHKKCLEFAIEYGADVNNISKQGRHILVDACEHANDSEDLCLKLIELGADPVAADTSTGQTALMAACSVGSAKVVQELLEGFADPNVQRLDGQAAAHEAAKHGFVECLMLLAAYGAKFDVMDKQGNSPVHYAALGHAFAIKFLSTRGCNPKPKNAEGFTAKQMAKDNGFKDCLKEVKKQERSFGKVGKDSSPWAIRLYDFCAARQAKLLDMFEKLDVDMIGKVTREDFFDVLSNANAALDDLAVKALTLAYDPNRTGLMDYKDFLNGKKYVNKNFLHSAMQAKSKKEKKGKGKKPGKFKLVVPICVQEDGPRTDHGGPPAQFIPKHIHFTDRDRFSRDNPPMHPLHDDSTWLVLLNALFDTPIRYLNKPETTYVGFTDAAKSGDMDSLNSALRAGYDVNTRDKFLKTPLMVAAAHGNVETCQFLLDRGADINAKDNFQWTPLHHACHGGIFEVVKLLVERGADINTQSMNQSTPIMRAIECSKLDIVEYLIERGAKIQTENKKGYTPLDISVQWADPRVYQIVKSKMDSLPPVQDKKKKGKKPGKKAKPKKPATADGGSASAPGTAPGPDGEGRGDGGGEAVAEVMAKTAVEAQERRGSILRAASALAGGLDEREDISYSPTNEWTRQKPTDELIHDRNVRCDRYGWEVDFSGFEMPFSKNVGKRVDVQGGVSES